MNTYVDPSQQTPLFTAQQVTCAYPISDAYAACPRYLYYSLLLACLFIRWHPWLSDAFLGAAATYAGVAAFEVFILLAGYPKPREQVTINIPFVNSSSLPGNATYGSLPNLVANLDVVYIQPNVMENDIDAILAIVVTGYLFMLPVHCWSTHIRGHRARHLLMGLWNILMLCATICALILWTRLADVPYQFRFCYPSYPDQNSTTNDGWVNSLWEGDWNSTIWNTFANPEANNRLTDNCLYPCFNTSQILRRPQSIVADLNTESSPRTNRALTYSQFLHQSNLAYFMYMAIVLSAVTAVVVLFVTATGLKRFTVLPLDQPYLIWTGRKEIKAAIHEDIKNLMRRKKRTKQPTSEKSATVRTMVTVSDTGTRRRVSLFRLTANLIAIVILFIVVVIIPATLIAFIVWIEWWIHRDLVSQETPQQVGQWGPAVSVSLVLISALVMRLKYRLASTEEIEGELVELRRRVEVLERLKEEKIA